MTKICQKFHISEYQHRDQGNPYLRHDCIAAGSEKSFNLQVLLDPLEKQLDLPASLVDIGNGFGSQLEIVGQKKILLTCVGILVTDSAQGNRTGSGLGSG